MLNKKLKHELTYSLIMSLRQSHIKQIKINYKTQFSIKPILNDKLKKKINLKNSSQPKINPSDPRSKS
jgi:hypothetical protein